MILIFSISFVVFIGFFVGTLELIQRYPETKYLFKKKVLPYALLYAIFNGIVSFVALLFVWYFKEVKILEIDSINLVYIFIAGFGGMAILRSSFFTIKLNGNDVNVGFAQFVTIIMLAFDRKISSERAPIKFEDAVKTSEGLKFSDMLSVISLCEVFSKHMTQTNKDDLVNMYNELRDNAEINENEKVIHLLAMISEFSDSKILNAISNKMTKITTEKKTEKNIDYYIDKLSKKK